ncbi:MAG: zinc-binding dehydrogenase [Cyanobacteria bacterium P01_H01_bin.153]
MLSRQAKRARKQAGIFLNVHADSNGSDRVENLRLLKAIIEADQLNPVIDRQYLLEQIVEAHRYVDRGHKKGNVVITL